MALKSYSGVFESAWQDMFISKVVYGIKTFGKSIKSDPFLVSTTRNGDDICVSANGYYKTIKMRDSFFDTLRGINWETRVRSAQREAFDTAYLLYRKEEKLNHQVNRLK
jgi:hypothetical protein